ncbi:glycosyltransferase [Enterococcus lemanii]|uniref:Glycosyltransferase family 4 protein n=1 Tax=Enterococcus lemanii TaxID=1159752 RepID=A0ABV9MWX6_9ENTE|nr:1,2-diacylglycerol 3-alpha-glucosyltransferase [Enterococcus lemanii]
MKIGFFTDTYLPQVSGVATSIKTLKDQLEKQGHEVLIFTTTDPKAPKDEVNIIRMPSVPFISFKERRVVIRGMWDAYLMAKMHELDLIHTHTEFGAGLLGKLVAKKMKIPVIHTYHTMYEDYLHYVAKGKIVRPSHVKYLSRQFVNHSTGIVCPSQRVVDTLRRYGATVPMRIIPTGIHLERFDRTDITEKMVASVRESWNVGPENVLLLSLSRLSYEKNIQAIIRGLPQIIEQQPQVRLMIVGNGPYKEELQQLVEKMNLTSFVIFVGEVPNEDVAIYYRAAKYLVSASTSETQGLTYTEAMAAKTQMVVLGNDYLDNLLSHPSLGCTFKKEEDFPKTVLAYMQVDQPFDPIVHQVKMHEISAEYFGEEMIRFYLEMQQHFQQLTQEKMEHSKSESLKSKLKSFKILVK